VAGLVLPILLVLFVWWLSTGAILYVAGLPRRTHRWSMIGATLLAVAALIVMHVAAAETGVAAACTGFLAAIVVWGWVEVGFLIGGVTGPRRTPCPSGSSAYARFAFAFDALLYHELAILLAAALVVVATAGQPNLVGLWTFLALWLLRLSAKINLFLGVPNLFAQLLPRHLAYLASYQRAGPISLFFPVSVTLATGVTLWVGAQAFTAEATPHATAEALLLATLLALGVIEHWFLVLPLPSEMLWSWGLSSRREERDAPAPGALVPALAVSTAPAWRSPSLHHPDRTDTASDRLRRTDP
jgi:putative photosynthetic complex assembly protein 2